MGVPVVLLAQGLVCRGAPAGEEPLLNRAELVQTFMHNMVLHLCDICQQAVLDEGLAGRPRGQAGGSGGLTRGSEGARSRFHGREMRRGGGGGASGPGRGE